MSDIDFYNAITHPGSKLADPTIDAIMELYARVVNLEESKNAISPTPPRDTYDLAEMITAKVQAGTWTAQAVADAIEKLYEARGSRQGAGDSAMSGRGLYDDHYLWLNGRHQRIGGMWYRIENNIIVDCDQYRHDLESRASSAEARIPKVDPADICPHGGGHRLVLDATAVGDSGTHYEILRCSACGYVTTGWTGKGKK